MESKVNQYKQLSQFRDLKDFNNHFEQWMVDVKEMFTKSQLVALKRLVRFSVGITGVCFAKIQTIVAATHENGIGISRSTFKRMLSKAVEVGLLVVHETFKKGKQSHNVYVFNRYKSNTERNTEVSIQAEPPKEEQLNHLLTNNLSKPTKLKDKDIRTDEPVRKSIDTPCADIIPYWIPKQFAQKAGIYFHSNEITELYRIGYIHSKMTDIGLETLIQALNEGLDVLVYRYRKGKLKSLMGYWNGICKKLIKKYWIIDTFDYIA